MAFHPNIPSMLGESLPEMLLVAKYCIEFRKDTKIWQATGCYGYPAALLLLTITDSIGSYIEKRSVENHFTVLMNKSFYSIDITREETKVLYEYRNRLSHNSVLDLDVQLSLGSFESKVLELTTDGKYQLNLIPFYTVTADALTKFIQNADLSNNKTIIDIYKKSKL